MNKAELIKAVAELTGESQAARRARKSARP